MPVLALWHAAKEEDCECALIESAKCGCSITRSSGILVEDKEVRTARYAAVLWGMMS